MAEPRMRDISIVARLDAAGLTVTVQGRAAYGDGDHERLAAHAIAITEDLDALRQALLDLVAANLGRVTDATIKGALEARDVAVRRGEMPAAGGEAREQSAHILDLLGGIAPAGDAGAAEEGV